MLGATMPNALVGCRRCRRRCRCRSSFTYSFITLLISLFPLILIHNWRDKRFNYAFRSVSFFILHRRKKETSRSFRLVSK